MHVSPIATLTRRRLAVAAGALAVSLASACAGGTGDTVPPPISASPVPSPSQSLVAGNAPLTITQSADDAMPSAGATTAIVLYAEQFLDFAHAFGYAVATQGASGPSVPVTWTLSGTAISSSASPSINDQTAPPNGIELAGVSLGKATLTAATRTQTTAIPVYFFPSIDVGCDFRAQRAAEFDPDPQPSRDPLAEDAYVTIPAPSPSGLNPCSGTVYATAPGTPTTFHFPYGATLVTNGDDPARPVAAGVTRGPAFEDVQATSFKSDFTSVSSTALGAASNPCYGATSCTTIPGSIVLLKTMGGRVVKLSIRALINGAAILGPYEVTTDPGGPFPY